MKYFQNAKSLAAITKEYRKLSKIHHPDKGGDPEVFKEVTRQRDESMRALLKGNGMSDHDISEMMNNPEYMEAVSAFGLEKLADLKNGKGLGSLQEMADRIGTQMLDGDPADLLDEKGNISFTKVAANVFASIFGKNLDAGKDEQKKLK